MNNEISQTSSPAEVSRTPLILLNLGSFFVAYVAYFTVGFIAGTAVMIGNVQVNLGIILGILVLICAAISQVRMSGRWAVIGFVAPFIYAILLIIIALVLA